MFSKLSSLFFHVISIDSKACRELLNRKHSPEKQLGQPHFKQ